MGAQALDRLGHRGVDLLGQADQEDECFHIAVADAAAVGAQDAADEGSVLVVLDMSSRPFRCQPGLDSSRPGKLGRWDVLSGWLTGGRTAVRSSS